MTSKNAYFNYHLQNSPLGTHRAVIKEVDDFCDESQKKYCRVTWYIQALDKTFVYCFRKSNSFLSKNAEFLRMLKTVMNSSLSSMSDLIGKEFIITVAVYPHYDEKELTYLKITDIKKETK